MPITATIAGTHRANRLSCKAEDTRISNGSNTSRNVGSNDTSVSDAVSEVNARDKHTIEFKMAEPRPASFMMSAFASGWNVIFRKKTLEDNNYNLRRVVDIPGTGPFKSKRRVENSERHQQMREHAGKCQRQENCRNEGQSVDH